MARFPARIHVLLAGEAPVGVVVRRGPSRNVCTLLWDRTKDMFHLGQWLRGRIYERRCDLSPDGKYLIYFAMNMKSSETRGSWTAISLTPYLKAITLYAKGDCWLGGGLFTSNKTYWLNDGCTDEILTESPEVRRDLTYQPLGNYGGECPSVYYRRLQRDGWAYVNQISSGWGNKVDIFEKILRDGWLLRKFAHAEVGAPPGKGCYWDEHELWHAKSGALIECPSWEWAEVERGRLVWAARGQLWAGDLHEGAVQDQKVLYDFNDMQFEPVEAPY
jgi:hypothetical protein